MHTERYPSGLRWACDRVGEGAARPAPRQGRTRAHPQRVTTTVPRAKAPNHPGRDGHAPCGAPAATTGLTDTARGAGATDPERLGEQLALLLGGASARSRVLNTEAFSTAAAIAAVLVDNAIPDRKSTRL